MRNKYLCNDVVSPPIRRPRTLFLGRCVPYILRPLDDASLNEMSRPWTAFRRCIISYSQKPKFRSPNPTNGPYQCPGLWPLWSPNLTYPDIMSVPPPVRDGSYGYISSKGYIFQEISKNKVSGTHRPRCTVNNFALKYFLKGHQGLPECTTRQTVTWTS